MFRSHTHADPPLTLAERLERLNDSLQSLGQQLREAVASAIGSAVAGAVRDAIRGLLAPDDPATHFEDRRPYQERYEPVYRGWDDPNGPGWYEEDYPLADRPEPARRPQGSGRWSNALGVALQAGLCWLRHQPRRRPVLTAVLVAVAAGMAALLAGPAVGAGAGVLASAAGLLLTADALSTPPEQQAGYTDG
jgi:hypothetical protein